jgi:hypothetical protein
MKIFIFGILILILVFMAIFIILFRIWYIKKQEYYNSFLRKKALSEGRSKGWYDKRKEIRRVKP